jgi:hypothetical protein
MGDEVAPVISLVTRDHRYELLTRANNRRLAAALVSAEADVVRDYVLVSRSDDGVIRIDSSQGTRMVTAIGMLEMAKSIMLNVPPMPIEPDEGG